MIDVVRTVVVTLAICVRRFVCEHEDCPQRTFDERFCGIGRGGASTRALSFFADLARGRATRAVARDLGVPEHYLRVAVGKKRSRANDAGPRTLGRHLAIDECAVKKNQAFASVFSDPGREVVLDVGPGRGGAVVWAFAGRYSYAERARVRVVTMDCHAPYRAMVRVCFPNALIVADAFHLHRRVHQALAEVRRGAWRRLRKDHPELAPVMKAARYPLARARDDLLADGTERGVKGRLVVYDATNLDAELGLAYELKEAFRAAMTFGKASDTETFQAAMELFDALCRGSGLVAFAKVAKTFRAWRTEILNYAATGGASNGFAESVNHLIKNQKRQAHGYSTWLGFRGQILWCFGEVPHPVTGRLVPLRSLPRGEGAA